MNANRLFRTSSGRAWLWRSIGLILTIGFLLSGSMVGAGEPTPPRETTIPDNGLVEVQETKAPAITNTKLDSSLNQLLDIHRNKGMTRSQTFATTRAMVLEGDSVQVVIVTTPQAVDKLTETVISLGGEVQGHYEGHLQALVPIDSLESLAEQQHVQRIREPSQPITLELTEIGSAITEGVTVSNVAAWHTAGYNGAGVRVAVIDIGFTNYSTLLGSDLPSSVVTFDWTIPGTPSSAHGTACAEIVHDMAPGASIDLHKISTDVELGLAVSQAISDGVDIISMSLGWTLDGPGDGTGYLASIVADARSHGIFYATAAGNEAEVTWAGNYVDSGYNDYHAWNGASVWYNFMGSFPNNCVIPPDYPLRAGLHWDDWGAVDQDYNLHLYRWPGGSDIYRVASSTNTQNGVAGQTPEEYISYTAGLHWDDWGAVDQDYNLHLYRWPGGSTIFRVASSTNTQNGGPGQTPEEYIGYTAAGGNCYAWVVERVSSNRDVCLRLRAPKTGHLNYWTTSRSIGFPADSPDAVTVGAVDVNSPYSLEIYSSQGPTFGTSGVCSGGSTKPDIVAYANVSTASYGTAVFNGTSAATPHVAGASALVKQFFPAYTVDQLQNYLESEALDLGAPGKDNLYGWGRLYLLSIKHSVYMPWILKNHP